MSNKHWTFWLVCVLGLLWNIGGAANYLMQSDLAFVNSLPETHQAIIIGRPAWATGGFAVGVFGGALACVLLMFSLRGSLLVFPLSLFGIIVTMVHTARVAISGVEFSVLELFVMAVLPLLVAAALLIYARYAVTKYGVR